MILQELIKTKNTFLVDASGVLYLDDHFLPEAATAFTALQKQGSTFLATNNSYLYVDDIAKVLNLNTSIALSPDYIISSGHGLTFDTTILNLITDKQIYFFGQPSSKKYLNDDCYKNLTENLTKADVVILASYTRKTQDPEVELIIQEAKKRKDLNIICCNWDRVIRSANGLMPVIGTIAKKIEDSINRPIYWFGKPIANFSSLVKHVLTTYALPVNEHVLFFDDNINNVVSMQNHIGISGCWVKSTGIYFDQDNEDLFNEFGKPKYMIDALDLQANVLEN